jgi:outer membrane protein insertion porin family
MHEDKSKECKRCMFAGNEGFYLLLLQCFAFILLNSIVSRPCQAQETSFQNQNVAVVDLVAPPQTNIKPLLPLIDQKAGEPFSEDKVRASISALKDRGGAKEVQVDIRPEAAGLRLTFMIQPVFYVGTIQFPGATKVFRYSRLLQVASLPEQEPYSEGRVAVVESNLVRFFQTSGYFKAGLRTENQIDEAHQLVNLLFHTVLNQRAKIRQVKIVGPTPTEAERLRQISRLKPGKVYTAEIIESAKRRIQSYLSAHGQMASRLRQTSTEYVPESNSTDVSFELTLGPTVTVQTVGVKLGKRTLRQLIPIYEEGTIDRDLIAEGERNLTNYFQSKGYFDVKVASRLDSQPSQLVLRYEIDKGKRHRVAEVSFQGNAYFSEADLLGRISIKKKGILSRGRLSQQLLKRSVESLTTLYRNAGFEEVKVEPQVIDREPDVYVTFHFTEGTQTLVESLRVAGNQAVPLAALDPDQFNLKAGQPFSLPLLSEDRDRVMALYLDRGYLNARFKSAVNRRPENPHRVEVVYIIEEGPEVRIGEVAFLGQDQTSVSYIKRTTDLQPREPLSQGKLLEAESRLYDLSVFDWTSVVPRRPIVDQGQEDVLVKVHEARRNTISYGFGFEIARRGGNVPANSLVIPGLPPIDLGDLKVSSSEKTFASPRGSIDYIRRNLRGRGQTLSLSMQIARLDQRGLLTYASPHFRGSQWTSLFSVSGERTTENPVFAARLLDSSYQLERPLGKARNRTLFLRYRFRRTTLSDLLFPELVPPEDRSVHLSTLSTSWLHDTRDKPLDAHRGVYETADFGLTPKALGSSANFVRFLGQAARYRAVGSQMTWANSLRLGFLKPFGGSVVPLSERFFSGGATSLRGFPINGAGPQRSVVVCTNPEDKTSCSTIRVPIGGNQIFIFNSELRFPLPVKKGLGGVLFYDGGNVFNRISIRHFFREYTNAIGFGLRYNTPIGPVRFDVGRNLNPVPGLGATQFFITLGQAF